MDMILFTLNPTAQTTLVMLACDHFLFRHVPHF